MKARKMSASCVKGSNNMNYNPEKTIVWEAYFFILLGIWICNIVLNARFTKKIRDASDRFWSGRWDGLYGICKNLRGSPLVSLNAMWNPEYKDIQSSLGIMGASIAYCEGQITAFLADLHDLKPDLRMGQKECMLALYYQSVGDYAQAAVYYQAYQNAVQKNADVDMLIRFVFSEQNEGTDAACLQCLARKVQNPALRQLFAANGITAE